MTRTPLTSTDFEASIRVLRPLLITIMCWAHIPILWGFLHPPVTVENPVSVFGTFLRDTLSRGAVPLLTVISGYLAFASYQRRSYLGFVTDKIKRILLPFLIWNVIMLLFLQHLNAGHEVDIGGLIAQLETPRDFFSAVIGYNRLPINAPTYFLRDLFLILLCVPAFVLLTAHKHLAVALTLILGVLTLTVFPPVIVFGNHGILYRNDMAFFFLAGFVFARHGFILHRQPDWKAAAGVSAFLAGCAFAAFWLVEHKPDLLEYLRYRPAFGMFLLLVLPYIVSTIGHHRAAWPIRALSRLSPYSFTIILSHKLVAYFLMAGLDNPVSRTISDSQLSNFSPIAHQLAFTAFYTGLCIVFGVVIKLTVDIVTWPVKQRQKSR